MRAKLSKPGIQPSKLWRIRIADLKNPRHWTRPPRSVMICGFKQFTGFTGFTSRFSASMHIVADARCGRGAPSAAWQSRPWPVPQATTDLRKGKLDSTQHVETQPRNSRHFPSSQGILEARCGAPLVASLGFRVP